MHSEREKVFYVEKMWSEGLRPAAAQQRWGRPSRQSLADWEKAALAGSLPAEMPRVPGACEHEKHSRYPGETRAEALRLASLGKPNDEIARMLGLPGAWIVASWSRAARKSASIAGPAERRGKAGRMGSDGKGKGGGDGIDSMTEEGLRERLRAAMAEANEANARVDALAAVLLDPKAGCLASLSSRRKAELGERLRLEFGLRLSEVLRLLTVSKSTYEYNRARLGAPERGGDADIEDLVREAFEADGDCARGYRFVWAVLRARGVRRSERRVRRVMRSLGLVPRCGRKARRYDSCGGETDEGAPNLLLDGHRRRVFSAGAPFELWLTDVTEFSIPAGRLYLSPVIDCFDGAPVAWSVSEHPDGALAVSMLAAAAASIPSPRLSPGAAGPILHADRGGLYRMRAWKDLCEGHGITRSMSRLGHSPDNARMEGFFGTMKNEMFHGRDWSLASLDDLRAAIDSYMSSFCDGRVRYFREGGTGPRGGKGGAVVYDTINGRRERLGIERAFPVRADPEAV